MCRRCFKFYLRYGVSRPPGCGCSLARRSRSDAHPEGRGPSSQLRFVFCVCRGSVPFASCSAYLRTLIRVMEFWTKIETIREKIETYMVYV